MFMEFVRSLQLAAATSIADVGQLVAFMVVNTGQNWMDRNITPSVPGGYWPQTLVSAAIEAAGDISKFALHDMSAGHMQIPSGGTG